MENESGAAPLAGVEALEHMTGPSCGSVTWLNASVLDILLDSGRSIRVSQAEPDETPENLVARLHRAGDTYEIEAPEGRPVWINGERITTARLENRDIIEFGEKGPLSRFCVHPEAGRARKTVAEVFSDGVAYLRVSRQPFAKRVFKAFFALLKRLSSETTIAFRITVIIAFLFLGVLAYQQNLLNQQLQQQIETSAALLDSFAAALARSGEQTLTQGDLNELREELGFRVLSNVERLEALEQRSEASGQAIAGAIPSVAFLQAAYGFREYSTGRMLRYVVDDAGRPVISPQGQPLLSLEGDGPVAERNFTGTGFVVGSAGALVTNRHVALPWENDASAEAMVGQGLEPVMIKFIVYLPGKAEAIPVELLQASDEADLAVLKRRDEGEPIPSLELADLPPAAGDEVIVMGYPTGLRSMLAQSGDAFIKELQETDAINASRISPKL